MLLALRMYTTLCQANTIRSVQLGCQSGVLAREPQFVAAGQFSDDQAKGSKTGKRLGTRLVCCFTSLCGRSWLSLRNDLDN